MKIVDVCAFYAPKGGGVRTYVDQKLIAAAAMGHDLVVIAPGDEDRVEPREGGGRIRWVRAPLFPLDRAYRYFSDREALYRTLDEEAPDVVEVSSPWRSASMVADWRGTARRVLVAHADPLSAYAYRWFGGIADRAAIDRGFDWYWRHLRRLDAKYDLVVSASDSLSRRLIEGGLTKVMTNPMGIEPGHFSPARRDPALRALLLAECGLGEDALLLLGVGRHSPEKRWGMVARAVTAAAASRPMGLVIVGDGHDRRSVIRAVGGNPHIRLVAPIRDRPQLATLMASADALVHGCEAETFCFVAAEAVASGLTVIAPDLGGAADCARANEGWTYKSASARSLSGALRQFAETQPRPRDPGRTRSMADHFGALFDAYAGLDPARTITR